MRTETCRLHAKLSELLAPAAVSTVKSRWASKAVVRLTPMHPFPTPEHRPLWSYSSPEMEPDCVFFYIWPHWLHRICEISPRHEEQQFVFIHKMYINEKDYFHHCCYWVTGGLANVHYSLCRLSILLLNAGVQATSLSCSQYWKAGTQKTLWSSCWADFPSSSLPTWKKKMEIWWHL